MDNTHERNVAAGRLLEEKAQLVKAIQDAGFSISTIRASKLIDVTTADHGYRTTYPMIEVRVFRKGQEDGIREDINHPPRRGFWKRLFSR